jgi:hypothetical protein
MPKHKPKPKAPKPVAPATPAASTPKAQAPVKPRDLPDPGVVRSKETGQLDPYAYKKNERGAKAFGPDGVKAGDVQQGAIGDCYLAAAASSVAGARPDAIKSAIKDNNDGTFTVRFWEVGYDGSKKAHFETVDADLPHRAGADGTEAPAYAKSTEKVDGKAYMELWPSLIEKAWAQWKGSYDAIGHGGFAGSVMTALTGMPSRDASTAGPGENDPLWSKMLRATADKRPMTAGSGGKDDPRYKDPKAGVYGWHAYSVLGVEEKKVGDKTERVVTLRNPWGKRRRDSDAAAVGDANNASGGGVFQLSWAEFRRLYDDVTVQGG